MTTVALDGRGAERGAEVLTTAAGTVAAEGIRLRVFGDRSELAPLEATDGVELIEAPGAITNDDEPVAAVRTRPDASIVMAAQDVAAGASEALVSAGPTGATMTAALFAMRRMSGLRRPALAVELPELGRGRTLLLDVGANSDVRAQDLVQFAFLGAAFSGGVLGVERPRVALLTVGEEPGKGTAEVVDAHAELLSLTEAGDHRERPFEFTGNVEGRDLLTGSADVVVTDGFTGNVTLKTMEGTARAVGTAVGEAARSGPLAALGGLLLRPALGGLRTKMRPDATGGAVLLGLRAVAVVAHGSSGPEGIANAVRLAARCVAEDSVARTAALMERFGGTRGALARDRNGTA